MSNANRFSTKITHVEGSSLLDEVNGLQPEFLPVIQKFTAAWFPVQKAALPILLNEHNALPQRDIVICSPTGIFKSESYAYMYLLLKAVVKHYAMFYQF